MFSSIQERQARASKRNKRAVSKETVDSDDSDTGADEKSTTKQKSTKKVKSPTKGNSLPLKISPLEITALPKESIASKDTSLALENPTPREDSPQKETSPTTKAESELNEKAPAKRKSLVTEKWTVKEELPKAYNKLTPKISIPKPVDKTTFKRPSRKVKNASNAVSTPTVVASPQVEPEPSKITSVKETSSRKKALESQSKQRKVKQSTTPPSQCDSGEDDTLMIAEETDLPQESRIEISQGKPKPDSKSPPNGQALTSNENSKKNPSGSVKENLSTSEEPTKPLPQPGSFESLLAKAKERKLKLIDLYGLSLLLSKLKSMHIFRERENLFKFQIYSFIK